MYKNKIQRSIMIKMLIFIIYELVPIRHYPIDSLIFCKRSLTSGDSSEIKFIENSLYRLINDSNSSTALTSKKITTIY